MDLPASYDLNDVIKTVRDGLSLKGKLYAVPFYAESSMTYYRKDLFDAKGLKMPDQPTWTDIQGFAEKTDRQSRRRLRHLLARPGRLGRKHGTGRHHGEYLRRPLV